MKIRNTNEICLGLVQLVSLLVHCACAYCEQYVCFVIQMAAVLVN